MDLGTTYLGFRLPHPLMPGASPLADELEGCRRLEDAGAPMIVLRSLFEEQIAAERMATEHGIDIHEDAFAEALSYLREPVGFQFGPESYLSHLERVKAAVSVPVVASLNGTSPGGWIDYARLIERAGADALELNLYAVATDPAENAAAIESRLASVVRAVRASVAIPLAVKVSPLFTSLPHFAATVDAVGADGMILFNRFYEPDVDVREQQVVRTLHLSTPVELLPRLNALALVSGRTRMSLAVTGGVHSGLDALKAVMCGAHGVQMVSALLERGSGTLALVRAELASALEENEYDSLDQVRGSMSLARCPDPRAYERVNYMQILQNWRG